jgi:hypothetical protein
MSADPDEALLMWQDVLDDVAAGRVSNLRCPFCQGAVAVDQNPQRTRLECKSCRRYIEGKLGD